MAKVGTFEYGIKLNFDNQSLQQLKNQFKEIDNMTTSQFQKNNPFASTDLREASKELMVIKEEAKQVQAALNKAFNSNLNTVNIVKFNQELNKLDLDKIYRDFSKLGAEGVTAFRNITNSLLQANSQMRQSHKLLDSMATSLKNTIKWGISSSIFNNLTGSLQKAWNYTKALDTSLNDIRIVTNKSAEDMENFAVQANKAAQSLGTSTKAYTEASLIFFQQGLGDTDVTARTNVTLKAANVTGQSTADVSEQLTAVWNGYKVSAEEAELYIDKLAAVASKTAANLEELSTGMSKVASAANIMGVDVDQLNAQLATIISVTRQAPETVGNALKTIYARMGDIESGLSDETTLGNYTAKMAQLGVNVLDTNGKLRDMGKVVEEIGDKWTSMSREQQIALSQTMAGTRQYNNLLALFDNWDMYTDALQTSADAAGTLQHQQDIYMESTAAHLQQLSTANERLINSFSDKGGMNGAIDVLTQLTTLASNFIESIGGGSNALLLLGSVATQVFSRQIAQSLTTAITNLKGAQLNTQLMTIETERLQKLLQSNAFKNDSGVEAQVQARARLQKANPNMSQEDKQIMNDLLDKLTNVTNKQTMWNDKIKQTVDFLNQIRLILNESKIENLDDLLLGDNPERPLELLSKLIYQKDKEGDSDRILRRNLFGEEQTIEGKKIYQDYIEEISKLNNDLTKNIIQQRKARTEATKKALQEEEAELEKKIKVEKQFYTDFIYAISEKLITGGFSKKSLAKVTTIITDINNLLSKSKGQWTNEIDRLFSKLNQEWDLVAEKIINDSETAIEVLKWEFDNLDENKKNNPMSNILKEDIDAINKEIDELGERLQQTSKTEYFVNIISGLGQIATGVNSIGNIPSILFDDKLNAGEKIIQTIMALGTGLGTLLNGYTMVNKYATEFIAKLKLQQKAQLAEAATKNVQTGATKKLTLAQIALNEAMKANPIIKLITALIALASAYSIISKAIKAAKEALVEQNEKIIENENKTQDEINTNKKLYSTWIDIYELYKQGKKSKEDMASVTDTLIDLLGKERVEVANLTKDYKKLNKEILEAQKKLLEKGYNSAEVEKNAARANLMAKGSEGLGESWSDNTYTLHLHGWSLGYNEEAEAVKLIKEKVNPDFIKKEIDIGIGNEIDFEIKDSAENIIDLYDQLIEARSNLQANMSQSNLSDSGVYAELNEWLNKMEETVIAFKEAEADSLKYFGELNAYNIVGISDENTTLDIFIEKREQLIDLLKEQTAFRKKANETEEEWNKRIRDNANEYISAIGDSQNELYLRKIRGIEKLQETFKETSQEEIKTIIDNLTDQELILLVGLDIDEDTSLNNIKDFVNYARHRIIGDLNVNDLLTGLQTGKITRDNIKDDEQYQNLLSELESIKDLYPELEAAANELQKTWNTGTQEYIEALELIQDKIYESKIKSLSETAKKEYEDITINITGELDDAQFFKELDDILDADYSIDIAIHSEAEQEFDSVLNAMDNIYNKASLIGDNWVVSANKVRELNDAFPGIIQGMKDLGDGTVQLNKEVAQSAIDAAQTEAAVDSQATIEKLQNQAALLRVKQENYQKMADAAIILAQGEEASDTESSKARADISDALSNLKQTNEKAAEEYSKESAKAIADDVYDNAAIIANNWKLAYQSAARDSFEFARVAIQNNLAASGMGTATKGTFGAEYKGGTKGTTSEATALKETQDLLESAQNEETNKKWAELAQKYQQLANNAGQQANDIEGMIAEIGARNIEFGAGLANIKNGSNKGGKNSNTIKELDTEIDRYHKINTQIAKVENSLKKLQNEQKKFVGAKLIDNLNKQWELLNTQINNYNKKLEIANGEYDELRKKLSDKGVLFNEDGTVQNYVEAIRNQEAYVNALITQYNTMAESEQENFKKNILEPAQKDYEDFLKNIDRIDELSSEFIPGLRQSIFDALDKQIEISIQKFNMKIEITLNMNQATREWNQWKKRIIDGIKEDDILGNAQARIKDYSTYYNTEGNGDVQEATRHVNEILEALAKMDAGIDNTYGNNREQALEDLKTYYDQLRNSLSEVLDLQEEIHQAVLDEMDRVQEKFSEQVHTYELLSEIIQHDLKITQMYLGEDAYGEMSKFYEKQQENYEKQLEFQRMQKDFWYAEMEAAEEGSKEWESAREKWESAVQEFNNILEQGLENAKNKFENAINDIFKKLNESITGGMGLDYVKTEWDLINENADRYLDTINKTYGIKELEKKYQKAINDSSQISVQQRLQKVMNEQVNQLKEKDRLTQYDLDRANRLYEIELARIELENAAANKSQMRLRRDSQGNYTYQYVTNQAAIDEAQNKIDELYNSLYNFDKERYNQVLNDAYDAWNEYQQAMAEAALINDPELRAERERMIQEQYNELMMQVANDYEVSKYNLSESFYQDLEHLNNITYNNLSEKEKEIINQQMIPNWENGLTKMVDEFTKEGGFAKVTQGAWDAIKAAQNQYKLDTDALAISAGITFETISKGLDDALPKTSQLLKDNKELVKAYDEELKKVKGVWGEVQTLIGYYEKAEKAAKRATEAAYDYQQQEKKDSAKDAGGQSQPQNTTNPDDVPSTKSEAFNDPGSSKTGGGSTNTTNNGSGGTPTPSGPSPKPKDKNPPKTTNTTTNTQKQETYTITKDYGYSSKKEIVWVVKGSSITLETPSRSGYIFEGWEIPSLGITTFRKGRTYTPKTNETVKATWSKDLILKSTPVISSSIRIGNLGMATGGYTGEWSNGDNNGRLAWLHQKELVLNSKDTKNLLDSVEVIRNLNYSLGSNTLARLAGVSANIHGNNISGGNGLFEQDVHIDATFPNVHNAAEIETALNNLVNAASQRVMEKR